MGAMRRTGMWALILALLGWMGAGWGIQAAYGQEKAEELSDKERKDLEQQFKDLDRQALVQYEKGRYEEATRLEKQALNLCRKLYPQAKYPDGHPQLAGYLHNLGLLLRAGGDLAKAESYYGEALAMRRKLYPKDRFKDGHAELAASLNTLGALLHARRELGKAEPFLREGLEMRRALFPKGHPDLALSLHNLGTLLASRGELAKAETLLHDALEMRRKLYPEDRFKRGHPDLIISLNTLGELLWDRGELGKAEPYYRDALALRRKMYPKESYKEGHPNLAASLNILSRLLIDRGELAKAEPFLREVLEMNRALYSTAKFPDGHRSITVSLHNLASQLMVRGEYAKAEPLVREALEMNRALYPKAKFPQGHHDLILSLTNWAHQLMVRGEDAKAETFLREALEMSRALYPRAKFPDGHRDIAVSLHNLAHQLMVRGEYAKAESLDREALEMNRALYPKAKFPDGNFPLIFSLISLGTRLQERGEYTKAETLLREALEMERARHSRAKFPNGHTMLVVSLFSMGILLEKREDYARAEPFCREALVMGQRLAALYADASAEAEGLNFLHWELPSCREHFLSVSANVPDSSAAEVYAVLWRGKASLAQTLERRQRLLHRLDNEDIRGKLTDLLEARRQLSRLLLGLDKQDQDRDQLLKDLTERKEKLEKELAAKLPQLKDDQSPYTDLLDCLSDDSAFVDFHRFQYRPKGEINARPHYVAFVLRKGRPVRRIELGPAEPIEKALADWRKALAQGLDSPAVELRTLVWEKLAGLLPDKPGSAVFLCPDAELSALPWAALPGRVKGTVLLEDHALALVPYGPFLLQQVREREKAQPTAPSVLLVVGGLRYDKAADSVRRPDDLTDLHPVERGAKQEAWPDLPGTAREVRDVADLATRQSKPPKVISRSGTQGAPGQLMLDLPQARWAHLATHGFFAAPDSSVRQRFFDEKDFLRGRAGERVAAGARSPLTQTGLVLTGANRTDKEAEPDGGILTAEAIAGLDLRHLDLAVLSACETGLGEGMNGEGVFGLQRAFHLAGCPNVVASLWKVDDDATAALMALFYHELWVNERPPLEALRRAQLALYRNPGDVKELARGRGPDFDKTVKRVTTPPVKGEKPRQAARVKDWAAFVLSGAGR